MNIPINFTVSASEKFTRKSDGKSFVKLTGIGAGLGLFQFVVPEDKIPDSLEGKIIKAKFKLYIDRTFSVRFGFEGIDGYLS